VVCSQACAERRLLAESGPRDRVISMTEPIHQELAYEADPDTIYETLISAKDFSEFTGAPAEIDAREGGAFSCFGGQIIGRIIELVPGERIVQAWRVAGWAEGDYSIVRFSFTKLDSGTRLTLDHSGFPDGSGEHLEGGWPKMYWDPLRRYLA